MFFTYSNLKNIKSKRDVSKFFDNIESLNVKRILILTKNKMGVTYPSDVDDRHIYDKSFDRYGEIVKEAKDRGIKVDAWFCLYIEDINSPSTLVKRYPEILLVNKYGKSNLEEPTWSYIDPKYSVYWVCPSSQKYNNFLLNLMEEVIEKYDVDGIHLDYVRYPEAVEGRYYCYCRRCLKRFKEEYGYQFPTNDVVKIRYFVTILCENVSNAVKYFSELAHKYGKDISAYVFTDYTTSIESCYQDWPYFSKYLNYIIPTLYEVSPKYIPILMEKTKKVVSCKIYPAIYTNKNVRRSLHGGKRWTKDRSPTELINIIKSILDAKVDGVTFFTYEGLFGYGKKSFSRKEIEKIKELLKML